MFASDSLFQYYSRLLAQVVRKLVPRNISLRKLLLLVNTLFGVAAIMFGASALVLDVRSSYVCGFSSGQAEDPAVSDQGLASVAPESQVASLYVDVAGAVTKPGVYQLTVGSRVGEAITAAGGFEDEADQSFIHHSLNLAEVLEDQEKIYVPYASEVPEIVEGGEMTKDQIVQLDSVKSSTPGQGKVSINTASLDELDSLEQVGAKRAEDIIAGRPYSSVQDLLSRNIIPKSVFEAITSHLIL